MVLVFVTESLAPDACYGLKKTEPLVQENRQSMSGTKLMSWPGCS